jgi:hypothetical protein
MLVEKMKNFREKFRKIDFLIPIVVGILLSWWAFKKEEYIMVFLLSVNTLIFARARFKLGYGTKDYRRQCKDKALKVEVIIRKVGRAILVPSHVVIIAMILFGIISNLFRQKYLNFLTLLGVEAFFITSLLFLLIKRNHQKHWKPTIIRLSLIVLYFFFLYLFFKP